MLVIHIFYFSHNVFKLRGNRMNCSKSAIFSFKYNLNIDKSSWLGLWSGCICVWNSLILDHLWDIQLNMPSWSFMLSQNMNIKLWVSFELKLWKLTINIDVSGLVIPLMSIFFVLKYVPGCHVSPLFQFYWILLEVQIMIYEQVIRRNESKVSKVNVNPLPDDKF